jgi:hypothetical protein
VLWRFLEEVVGATGFEPATPCAQGKLGVALKVLILEQFAASEIWCGHFCGRLFGEPWNAEAILGKDAGESTFGD